MFRTSTASRRPAVIVGHDLPVADSCPRCNRDLDQLSHLASAHPFKLSCSVSTFRRSTRIPTSHLIVPTMTHRPEMLISEDDDELSDSVETRCETRCGLAVNRHFCDLRGEESRSKIHRKVSSDRRPCRSPMCGKIAATPSLETKKDSEPLLQVLSPFDAQDRNRTCTGVTPLGPEPSASASSATWAEIPPKLLLGCRFLLPDRVGGGRV